MVALSTTGLPDTSPPGPDSTWVLCPTTQKALSPEVRPQVSILSICWNLTLEGWFQASLVYFLEAVVRIKGVKGDREGPTRRLKQGKQMDFRKGYNWLTEKVPPCCREVAEPRRAGSHLKR